jgi:raffinose/stachyose/melibiose transport system permease protein
MMRDGALRGKRRNGEIGGTTRALLYIVLITFTVLTIYPLIWLTISSFKTTQEFQLNKLGLPIHWTLINYPIAWQIGNFGTLFMNSLFYTTASTLAVVFLSLAAGFAFAKIRSRATPLLHGSFVIGILLTIQSLMIPLFLVASVTRLVDTRLGVLIPYVGMGLPLGIYLCTEYIKGFPDAIVESARLEGAGYLKIYAAIIVPMAKPVFTTVAVLNVAGVWNEFMLVNMLVSKDALRSLPVGIFRFSGALASDYGKQFAALMIGLIPMIIFFLFFRNQITKGVSAGAVK